MNNRILCALSFICICLLLNCSIVNRSNNGKFDDASKNLSSQGHASLDKYLVYLRAVVKEKDTEKLIKELSPMIHNLNDEIGVENFIDYWNLNSDSLKSPIWILLKRAFELEGKMVASSYAVPMISLCDGCSTETLFYVTSRTNLYSEPNTNSQVISTLSVGDTLMYMDSDYNFSVLTSLGTPELIETCIDCWMEVSLQNKYVGYVKSTAIWDISAGVVVILIKEDDVWRINSIQANG